MKRFVIACLSGLAVAPAAGAQEAVPEIPFTANADPVKLPPGKYFGEVAGVAMNSKRHLFVFSRTGQRSDGARRSRRRSCSSSVRTARSSARSERTSMDSRSLIRSASTRTTTSGRRTKGRT